MPDRVPQIAPPNDTGSPRILIPGGIGDAYWVMVKMEAFCCREGITEPPTVLILAESRSWDESRVRSLPFLDMVPFIRTADPCWIPVDPVDPRPQELHDIYVECREKQGRTCYPGFMGYEYFLSYNGIINSGNWIENADDLECNWYLPLTVSEGQERFMARCTRRYGKYMALYFSNFTEEMITKFPISKIIKAINQFVAQSGLTPVFIGAEWDLGWSYLREIILSVKGAVNLVGKTSLAQVFGAMRGAKLVVGYHCGLTNMAIMFRKPTALIWVRESFPPASPLAVAPPETRNTTYRPLFAEDLTVDRLVGTMNDLYGMADG